MNALTRTAPVPAANPLRPQTFAEMERFCTIAARSGMVPTAYASKPDAILIAVQMGTELGLAPMQSLQSIAVIQGRPAVFGDAMPGLVRASGVCSWIEETLTGEGDACVATCSTLRTGDPKPTIRSFSVPDAKKAGLWGKSGPWQQYPTRMLAMRARSWCLRDAYPDVLRGLIAVEEAQDIPAEPPHRGVTIEAEPIPPAAPLPPRRTFAEFLGELQRDLDAAHDREAVDAIISTETVGKVLAVAKPEARAKMDTVIAAALAKFNEGIEA